jgi:iron-regulated transporter 1
VLASELSSTHLLVLLLLLLLCAGMVRGLVAGVVMSRTGLWTADLAVTQLMQERVPPHELAIVAGVQGSLCSAFELLSFSAGIFISDPTRFYYLMLASLAMVATAFALYAVFALQQRKGSHRAVPRLESEAHESGAA